ncbi:MAG TPA: alpha/beta fold hydrolase [Anaerolineae bacterium]|nr:alpha/beta fold hydrolase [Anaerolineae bacterium]
MKPAGWSEAFLAPEHQTYLWPGGQPAALLLHGFPGTPAETRALGQVLHGAGWTVQGLLLPGFGTEIDRLNEYAYGDWVRATVQAVRSLQAQHRPVLLAGFSMGAAVATVAAANAQPDGLALLAPFSGMIGPIGAIMPVLRRLIPTVKPFRLFKPDFSDPEVRKGMATFLPGVDLADPGVQRSLLEISIPLSVIDELRLAGQASRQAAASVHAATLIIQGVNDRVVLPKISRQFVYAFPVPARYVEAQAAHDLLDENGPAWPEVADALLAFAGQLIESQGLEIPG